MQSHGVTKMLLNNAQFDWLTLTSFMQERIDDMRYELFAETEQIDTSPSKRLQYKGVQKGNNFWGIATQRGKTHYMWQSSGEAAEQAYIAYRANEHFSPYDWNVTRCDLQVTIRKPYNYDALALYRQLDKWDGPGRKRQLSIIKSGDGCDTIYIGNRTSDRYTRIYVKPLDDGTHALRFEIEYKSDHAHYVFHDCVRNPERKRQYLSGELQSLPISENPCYTPFLDALGWNPHRPPTERVVGENSTLDWLRDTVGPSLARMANDHEYHDSIVALVKQWYNDIVLH